MLYNFLGQEINVGDIVGDLVPYNTVPNILFMNNVSSIWNPVTYMIQNGGIPESDYTYTFHVDDNNMNFYVCVRYSDSTHFKVGYYYSETLNEASIIFHPFANSIDKNNITEYDSLSNGFVFVHVGLATIRFETLTNKFGYGIGFNDPMTNSEPVIDYGTGGYELYYDSGIPDPRYIWDESGDCYWQFINGIQGTYIDSGLQNDAELLLNAYGDEISSFDEDYAEPSGGIGGQYNFYSDTIGFSPLPSLSIIDAGIATMWNPTPEQMKDFTDYLWTDNFFDNIIKLVADPLENVIQFGVVPFTIPSNYLGTSKAVKVGNISTGVQMIPLNQQYVAYDCGSVTIPGAWKTALDFEPMTMVSLYVPFIGFVTMTANEVINANSIQLHYNIDLLSGDCIAEIRINKNYPKGVYLDSVVYHKSGNLMQQMPLTGANYGRIFSSMLHTAGTVGANMLGGNVLGAVDSAMNVPSLDVERTNGYTGSTGILGCEQPYILLSQPVQVFDALYPKYEGYPCYLSYTLNSLNGFVKVESLIDNTVVATDAEKTEIEQLLKEGVIL